MVTQKPKAGLYRAKTLAAAAGISTNLLRAWERRYPLFEPERQPSQHRLYTDQDMAVIRRIRKLLDSGLSIGEISALGREALLSQHQPRLESSTGQFELAPLTLELEGLVAELAPRDLRSHRSTRFAGEDLGVSVRQLHPMDLASVFRLYQILKGTYEIWMYMEQRLVREVLLGRLLRLFEDGFQAQLHLLGAATDSPDPLVRAALEDAKGGALAVLFDFLKDRDLERLDASELHVVLTLARDHAKMMRNALIDLDEAVREGDENPKAHSLRPILRKLTAYRPGMQFQAGTNYEGSVSCRCLETSALDRVTYNFLSRALTSDSPGGGLWVSQINDQLCRWAFECTVGRFRMPEANELPVRAVAMAVGVTPEEALSYAYLGSVRRAGRLWAWFHWPVYAPPQDVPHCHCEPLGH